MAVNYVAHAGWSAVIKRVPEAFGAWLPFAGVLMLVVFLIANHDLFHWTHEYLYDESDPRYDEIIAGKEEFLNFPFYLIRMVVYFGIWYFMYWLLRRESPPGRFTWGNHLLLQISEIFSHIFGIICCYFFYVCLGLDLVH